MNEGAWVLAMQKKAKFLPKKKGYLNNNGATMIVAIIVIAILMIMTFSLMLVTYTLYASSNKKAASERNSTAANSLSLAIEKELTSDDAIDNSWLWKYLRCNLLQDTTWPYYDPDYTGHTEEEAFRYFKLKYNNNYPIKGINIDGFPGEVRLCMYWMPPTDVDYNGKELSSLSISERSNIELCIEIICDTGSQSYTVKDTYEIAISELMMEIDSDQQMKKKLDAFKNDKNKNLYNPMKLNINSMERWVIDHVSRE